MDKTRRIRTSGSDLAKISVWLSQNSASLSGKRFKDIAGKVRNNFPAMTLSDGAIFSACQAAGVETSRNQASRDRVGMLAAVVIAACDRMEKLVGADAHSLLPVSDRELLQSFVDRTKEPAQ